MMIVNPKSKEGKIKTAVIILTVLTVAVIWFNSSLPVSVSKAQSSITEDIVQSVVPKEIPIFEYLINHIRKSAHVIEYALLGAVVFVRFAVTEEKPVKKGFYSNLQRIWNIVTVPLFVSVTDESIQILSGRGPSVKDILIDMSGAVSAVIICFLAYSLIKRIKLKNKV